MEEKQENALEIISNKEFTPEERLAIKGILVNKIFGGIEAKFRSLNVAANFDQEIKFEETCNVCRALNETTNENRDIVKEYALKSGISQVRYEELKMFVYEHETNF